MQLTNYWWLLIWILGAGFILMRLQPERPELVLGKKEYRWGWLYAILLALPYALWAGFRGGVGDSGAYSRIYTALPNTLSSLSEYWTADVKDKGYTILSIAFKSIFGDSYVTFFVAVAFFQMFALVYVYRKYSTNYFLSVFLFIASTDYISWMMNGMRQFIAVSMIFLCFGWIVKKKYIPVIFVIFLATSIHGSAILMLPILFVLHGKPWNKRTIIMLFGICVAILAIDRFIPFLDEMLADTQYSDLVTNELWVADDGTNIIRVLVYSVPALMSLFGIRQVRAANNPIINISINGSVVSMGLYLLSSVSSGVYIGRLPIYTSLMGYIALPWLIDNMFEKRSARLVKICMVGGYLGFFYFQMHFGWGMI